MKKRGFKASHASNSSHNTSATKNNRHNNNPLSKFLDKHVFHSTDGERFILILFTLFIIFFHCSS